jgi:hypothetical protein
VYVDSTLIQASAAVDSMVQRDDLVQPPLSIEEYVQRLYTENDPASENDKPPRHPQRRSLGGAAGAASQASSPGPTRRSLAKRTRRPRWSTGQSSAATSPTRHTWLSPAGAAR